MKILLVDDHHLIREGLRPVLQKLAAPGEALSILEASTFAAAMELLGRHGDLDLVLLDLRLPDVAGFGSLEAIQARDPGLPVVIMSGDEEPIRMREALRRGALGYIPKSSPPQVILHALQLVLAGAPYVPPEAMHEPVPAAASSPGTKALNLTARQADVLALLIAGKSNKQICRELHLAEGTVKAHVAAIFRALDVTTRLQAVATAAKLGIKG